MTDSEIQFGEMEEAHYQQSLRPDRNRHYAVVAVGAPDESDLPIYVELDALRDMEIHAVSNTRVELGGVLLGGQYEDEGGVPFVVVSDSLRAEHYEASKGSFKFTHDTWAEITRQREQFPDELQMVGWYHTHPDWGVFLSSMDTFICDHFFNRPLDVALVIDPCRGDRGWFQWTFQSAERQRRVAGFYLIGSRHRRLELELFAAQLEGRFTMASDPRFGVYPSSAGSPPTSVVNIPDARLPWLAVTLGGMLTMQFLLLVVLSWRLLVPVVAARNDTPTEAEQQVLALAEQLEGASKAEAQLREADLKLEVLERVVNELGQGTPDGAVRLLAEMRQQNQRLEDDARVYRSMEQRTAEENRSLALAVQSYTTENKRLLERVVSLKAAVDRYDRQEDELTKTIAELKKQTGEEDEDSAEGGRFNAAYSRWKEWIWAGGGVLLGIVLAFALQAGLPKEPLEEVPTDEASGRDPDDAGDKPPRSGGAS